MKKIFNKYPWILAFLFVVELMAVSCETDELYDPSLEDMDNELTLTLSEENLELQEKFLSNEFGFNWSSGTNKGTNASIRYSLEIDTVGGDFSDPLLTLLDKEQDISSVFIDHGTFNHRLLENGLEAGKTYELEARVIAEVANDSVEDQMASVNFTVTTYKPVSNKLFVVGGATPNGWDIANATQLQASTAERGVFTWEGALLEGNFKFAVNTDDCFCQDFYTMNPEDSSVIVYNEGGSGEDIQWTVEEAGKYRLRVDLLDKTFSMEPVEDAPFSEIYMVGDATESGWNVEDPAAFTQDSEDPFIFTYEGNLNPGNFKILAGELGDFCGEWYRPLEDGQEPIDAAIDQRVGCDPDYNWAVTEETAGRYEVTLNTLDNTIEFKKINLYIVGDGSPSGWDINTPMALTYDNGDFVFNGELGTVNPTGEFKFSNQQGDWCGGEWVNSANPSQSISNSEFLITTGCEGPDNKWKLKEGDAGTYEIRINLDAGTMSITPL